MLLCFSSFFFQQPHHCALAAREVLQHYKAFCFLRTPPFNSKLFSHRFSIWKMFVLSFATCHKSVAGYAFLGQPEGSSLLSEKPMLLLLKFYLCSLRRDFFIYSEGDKSLSAKAFLKMNAVFLLLGLCDEEGIRSFVWFLLSVKKSMEVVWNQDLENVWSKSDVLMLGFL